MVIQEVVGILDAIFHPSYQEQYDNSGFLFGEEQRPCLGIMIALDLTMSVIDEAIEKGDNLIITHHPFIFKGLKTITDSTATGQMIYRLAENHISVYAAHTNLDNMAWGVNGELAQRLGLHDCHILQPLDFDPNNGIGMMGLLPHPTPILVFLEEVKNVLGIPFLRTSHFDNKKEVKKVALCGGAGSFLSHIAQQKQADIFLTSDLKYHDFQVEDGNMVLCDVGHFESEQFANAVIYRVVSEKISTFACHISRCQRSLVRYI